MSPHSNASASPQPAAAAALPYGASREGEETKAAFALSTSSSSSSAAELLHRRAEAIRLLAKQVHHASTRNCHPPLDGRSSSSHSSTAAPVRSLWYASLFVFHHCYVALVCVLCDGVSASCGRSASVCRCVCGCECCMDE